MANNQILASDNFVSGVLAAEWSALPTILESAISSGPPYFAQPQTISGNYGQYWGALVWPTDQICEVTIETLTAESGTSLSLYIRNNLAGNTYLAKLNNGIVAIQRVDSGVVTDITDNGSPMSINATFTTGDVVAFGMMGSCLFLYKNFKQIWYGGDATYTSGYPAFATSSTVNVIHCQVASWRGYSALQQDGIWTKIGVIAGLRPTTAELSSSSAGSGVTGLEGVRFEDNAQILSGNVWKGYFATSAGICYAESSDGISWVRYSGNPIISGYQAVDVFKYNGTYYLWAQTTSQSGSGPAYLFTSADGVNFAGPISTNLGPGSSGQWDSPSAYFGLHIADVIDGVFYGLYSALNGSGGEASTGLATSPDGITWAKYAGNPILTGVFCGTQIVKINGTYYAWMNANQPGQGNSVNPGFDPLETVRYQSTDLIHWTNPTHSIHNIGMAESLNSNRAGVFAASLVQFSNRVAMYYEGSNGDSIAPQIYQTWLALAPIGSTLSNIVEGNEDGTIQIGSDNFPGSSLSSKWTAVSGTSPISVSGGVAQPSIANAVCAAVFNGAFSPNQYAEVTIETLSGTNNINFTIPMVRALSSAQTGYVINLTGPTGSAQTGILNIDRKLNGINTLLYSANQITPQIGDVFRFSVVNGSDGLPVLSVFQNGFLIAQCQDYSSLALQVGNPGLLLFATSVPSASQINLFAAGNAGMIPSYTYSVPDCRDYGSFPNTPVNIQGTLMYTGQISSNFKIPPADCRVTGAPIDCRLTANIPQNSRTPGTYGPGE